MVQFDYESMLYSKLRLYLNKVTVSEKNSCATAELVVIKPNSNLDKYFLALYLRSTKTVTFFNNDAMGAKMPRTNMKTFRELGLTVPFLDIQQKVVAYRDAVSEKINTVKSAQKQKMQHLLELKSSILDRAFHGKL